MTNLDPVRARELQAVLHTACAQAKLHGSADAELIKYTNNATYRLSGTGVIARIGIGVLGRTRAPRLVRMARWLAERDAPTVRLLELDQPIYVDDHAITFWHEIPATAMKPDFRASDLAVPVRAMHRLPISDASDLPKWNPFAAAALRLDAADPMLDPDALDWLREQWALAEQEYQRLPTMQTGVIHGDVHTGNLLRTPTGMMVLADLDSAGIGPVAWDLAVVAVDGVRFGHREFYDDFAAAYGADVTSWAWWQALRRIRELLLVTSAIPDLGRRPEIAAEHAYRMRTLRTDHQQAAWRPYQ